MKTMRPAPIAACCRLARFSLVTLSLASLVVIDAGWVPASAQERVERRSIINLLFGGPRRATSYPPAPPPPRFQPAPQQRQSAPARSANPSRGSSPSVTRVPSAPAVVAVEKAEDARTILVIGDFMASGLAEGLEAAFADTAEVVVTQDTNGSSGLVRNDFFDWPATLPTLLDTVEPDILTVMLGSNDRQPIRQDGASLDVRSQAWTQAYALRVETIVRTATERDIPLVWVGAPAFQSPSLSADILAINDIFRDRVAASGGEFVDIWDGFVDEAGKFVFTGSDIQGQQVRLRGSDGINMTSAGKRKIAFYAEKPLRRLLDSDQANSPDALATLTPGLIGPPTPAPVKLQLIVRTEPIAITDPALDGADQLLGASLTSNSSNLRTPRDILVEDGLATPAPFGRVDYFQWPPRREAAEREMQREAGAPPRAGQQAVESRAISDLIEEAEQAL